MHVELILMSVEQVFAREAVQAETAEMMSSLTLRHLRSNESAEVANEAVMRCVLVGNQE